MTETGGAVPTAAAQASHSTSALPDFARQVNTLTDIRSDRHPSFVDFCGAFGLRQCHASSSVGLLHQCRTSPAYQYVRLTPKFGKDKIQFFLKDFTISTTSSSTPLQSTALHTLPFLRGIYFQQLGKNTRRTTAYATSQRIKSILG